MSTITRIPGGVCAAQGFTANGIHCGIRKNKTKHDLSVIYSDTRAATACVYTTNRVKGAPLTVTKNHIADGYAQAVICNSGNANTCNANGIEIAEQMSDLLGNALHISPADVVVASTGVIGQTINVKVIEDGEHAANTEQTIALEKPFANPFTDVPAGSWYEAPVLWAKANGITSGLSATEFGATATCTRAQVVTFLYAAFGK